MRFYFLTISNGVRQGGILSQKLFSFYIDNLSSLLISSGIGCFLDKVCFNHIFYADDLCLMAPCAIKLQELLNICHSYSITVDIYREFIEINKHKKKLQIYIQELMAAHIIVDNGYKL